GVPHGLVLLRSHEHDGGHLGGPAGRRERARAGRSHGPGPAQRDPRVLHPAPRRLPAVLERGAGVLTPANTGRRWRDVATQEAAASAKHWRRRERGVTAALLSAPMLWLGGFFRAPGVLVGTPQPRGRQG